MISNWRRFAFESNMSRDDMVKRMKNSDNNTDIYHPCWVHAKTTGFVFSDRYTWIEKCFDRTSWIQINQEIEKAEAGDAATFLIEVTALARNIKGIHKSEGKSPWDIKKEYSE